MGEQTSGQTGEGQESEAIQPTSAAGQVNSQSVPLEDFRRMQSAKDREVAAARRMAEEAAARAERVEAELENLIADPVKKQAYINSRQQAQLDYYKAQEEMQRQREWFMQEYGVPLEVVSSAQTGPELTKAVLDWQKTRLTASAKPAPKAESKKTEDTGGDDVALSTGAPPERQQVMNADIEKQIDNLRVTARKGGSAGERARLEILELQKRLGQTRTVRAKV